MRCWEGIETANQSLILAMEFGWSTLLLASAARMSQQGVRHEVVLVDEEKG